MGFFGLIGKNTLENVIVNKSKQHSRKYGSLLAACAILPVFVPDVWVAFLHWWSPASMGATIAGPLGEHMLRWALALAPAAVILHHALHLLYVRHHDFPTEKTPESSSTLDLNELKELYFGGASIAIKFGIPLVLTGALCSMIIAALLDLRTFSSWLPGAAGASWATGVHRAAAFGFVGSYLYVILLLTQRAFRRDVTSGVALWIATMFVAGPLMAGVFSLFWSATPGTSSVGVDVVYLVAGMLPRQFATIAQDLARRLLQPSVPTVPGRTIPLTTVRGINAEIEERLAEEGINDVATLAYADPYLLLRTTSFDRRQIVNWIDEAQLVMWFPDHWQALEKNGFTGAMDVAWAHGRPTLAQLATEIKIPQTVLEEAALRLSEDAQIQDLYAIYWKIRDQSASVSAAPTQGKPAASNQTAIAGNELHPLIFTLDDGLSEADQQSIIKAIGAMSEVRSLAPVESTPRMWRAYVPAASLSAVSSALAAIAHVQVQSR